MAAKETAKTKKVKTIYLQIIFCDTGIDLVDSKEKDISRHFKVYAISTCSLNFLSRIMWEE